MEITKYFYFTASETHNKKPCKEDDSKKALVYGSFPRAPFLRSSPLSRLYLAFSSISWWYLPTNWNAGLGHSAFILRYLLSLSSFHLFPRKLQSWLTLILLPRRSIATETLFPTQRRVSRPGCYVRFKNKTWLGHCCTLNDRIQDTPTARTT